MDRVTSEWHAEYLYRRLFPGLTHEQYLDEPGHVIQWMTRIDRIERSVEQARRKAEAGL